MIPRRRNRGRPPRAFLTWSLIFGSLVLLLAIIIGNQLGDRVLSQVTERTKTLPTPVAPSTAPTQSAAPQSWKQVQVTAVATDPHFPDPRVTPPRPPTPRPTLKPTPSPSPTPPSATPNSISPAPSGSIRPGEAPRPTLLPTPIFPY